MLKRLLGLCIVLLILATSSSGQAEPAGIQDCVDTQPDFILVYGGDYYIDYPADSFVDLQGKQVKWLGYAPRSIPNYWLLERQGIEYGLAGIHLDYLEPLAIIELYDKDGLTYERFTLSAYFTQYFITETSLAEFGRADGTAFDYHILPNPRGGACMWLVDELGSFGDQLARLEDKD